MGPQRSYTQNQKPIRITVLQALKYVNDLAKFTPVMMREDPAVVSREISSDMRLKLSRPAIYASLQILSRLNDFADETETAYREVRATVLPDPKNDVDYTLRLVWNNWVKEIRTEHDKTADWHVPNWNPYADVAAHLTRLVSHVWSKHFMVKDL